MIGENMSSAEIDDDVAGDAVRHLYWSRSRSNAPPSPKTLDEAKASRSDATKSEKEWTPIFKWGQKKDRIVLTIFVPCLEKDAATVDVKPRALTFRAERIAVFAGNRKEQREYTLSLKLYAEVEANGADIALRHDHVRVTLTKKVAAPWRSLQEAGIPKHPNERPDFDLIGDGEDEDEDEDVLCRPVRSKSAPAGARRREPSNLKSFAQLARSWTPSFLKPILSLILSLSVFELLPIAIITGHVALNPYNKVEESFGLQATHDLLFHRMDLSAYDHHMFPGVVPRTFLGPLLLAGCSSPLVACLSLAGATKLAALYVVRLVLGLLSACGVVAVMRATRRQYGYDAFRALALLSACQFHYPFYASRTLPNTFASLLVLPATAAWIDGDVRRVIRLLTIAVVIFRAELVLLLAPLALLFLATSRISFPELLRLGFGTAFVALALTVAVDSVLWRRPLYPEGEVLWFNTILNKSSEYGTAPWHWYFSSALPRAMLLSYPLALLSPLVVGQRIRELVAVPVLFVALYSILPHKELRFVLYALPPLNVAAAVAAARLYRKLPEDDEKATKETRMLAIFGRLGTVLMLVASFGASCLFLMAAAQNYPGALALHQLHALGAAAASRGNPVHVHIGVDAAVSGVSRFLELGGAWRYSKAEDLEPSTGLPPLIDPATGGRRQFAYALANPSAKLPGFTPVHVQTGFDRISTRPPFFHYAPKVVVLKRQSEPAGKASTFGEDL